MSNDLALIKQTLARYCHRVDRGTAAEVAQLFTEDAVLRPYYDGQYECEGRAEIQGWYVHYHEHFRANIRHLKHMITSAMIDVDGDSASCMSYLIATFVSNEDDSGYYVTGTYTDQLVKIGGDWLFKDRTIEVEFMAPQTAAIEEFPPTGYTEAHK